MMRFSSAQVLSQQQHFAQQMSSALQRPQMQAIEQQPPAAIQHGSAMPPGVGKHSATAGSHMIKVTSRSVNTAVASLKTSPPSWTSGSAASSPARAASNQQPAHAHTTPRTSTGPTPTQITQGTAAGDGSGRSTVVLADVSMNTNGQVESAPSAVASVVQKETVQVGLRTVHFGTAAPPASVQSGAPATVTAARIKFEPQPLQNVSTALATTSASPAKAMPTPNIAAVPPVEGTAASVVCGGGGGGARRPAGGPATRIQPTLTHPHSAASPTPQAGGDPSTALVRSGPPHMVITDNETLTRSPRRFHMTDVNAQDTGRPIPSLMSTIPHPAINHQHLPLSQQEQYFGHGHGPTNMLQCAPPPLSQPQPPPSLPCAPPPRETNNNGCFDFNSHVPPKRFSPRSCTAVGAPPAKKQPQPIASPFNTLSPQSANQPSGSFVRMVLKERQPLPPSALSLTEKGREMVRSMAEERQRSAGADASKESAPGKSTQPAAPVIGEEDDSDVEVLLVTPGKGKRKQKSESRAISCSKEKEREKRSRSRARSKSRHRERSRERDRRSRSRGSRERGRERDRHGRRRSRHDGSRSRSRERRNRERDRRSH